MSNVMVLTENTSEITAREKHAPTSIMTLYARLFTKMRANDVHLDSLGADEAIPGLFISIDTTQTWTKITVSQMSVSQRSLARGIDGGK